MKTRSFAGVGSSNRPKRNLCCILDSSDQVHPSSFVSGVALRGGQVAFVGERDDAGNGGGRCRAAN